MRSRLILSFSSLLMVFVLHGQSSDSSVVDYSKRKAILWSGTGILYGGSLLALDQLWYQDYERSGFHFFNDNQQWLGMDKVGHVYSAYVAATTGIKAFEWAGYSRKKSAWIGGSIGSIFLGTIEVFDGFSEEWGFSYGDFVANTAGSALAISQYLLWNEQIIRLKFSYAPSAYRKLRPEILGEDEVQAVFKDYNGQTYWASLNLNAIDSRISPRWLNLAVGYSGDGMINAKGSFLDQEQGRIDPKRQVFLSLDIDFERIPSKKPWVRTLLTALNYFKFPFPALELKEGSGLNVIPLHF